MKVLTLCILSSVYTELRTWCSFFTSEEVQITFSHSSGVFRKETGPQRPFYWFYCVYKCAKGLLNLEAKQNNQTRHLWTWCLSWICPGCFYAFCLLYCHSVNTVTAQEKLKSLQVIQLEDWDTCGCCQWEMKRSKRKVRAAMIYSIFHIQSRTLN